MTDAEKPKRIRRPTLVERIDAALNGEPMGYWELARTLYPNDQSWRYQMNGGPPGCYMALSAGLARGKFVIGYQGGQGPHRTVYPRRLDK